MPILLFNRQLRPRSKRRRKRQSSILYSGTPKKYEIGGIKVEGVKNYEDYVLIGLSGLSVGQTIVVPGDDITTAVKRYWRHGLFSDVQILAEKNCWRQDLFKKSSWPNVHVLPTFVTTV